MWPFLFPSGTSGLRRRVTEKAPWRRHPSKQRPLPISSPWSFGTRTLVVIIPEILGSWKFKLAGEHAFLQMYSLHFFRLFLFYGCVDPRAFSFPWHDVYFKCKNYTSVQCTIFGYYPYDELIGQEFLVKWIDLHPEQKAKKTYWVLISFGFKLVSLRPASD